LFWSFRVLTFSGFAARQRFARSMFSALRSSADNGGFGFGRCRRGVGTSAAIVVSGYCIVPTGDLMGPAAAPTERGRFLFCD
jgi:hypothetical protein